MLRGHSTPSYRFLYRVEMCLVRQKGAGLVVTLQRGKGRPFFWHVAQGLRSAGGQRRLRLLHLHQSLFSGSCNCWLVH